MNIITPILAIAPPHQYIIEAWTASPPIAKAIWILGSLGLAGSTLKGNQGGNSFLWMFISALLIGALILRAIYT